MHYKTMTLELLKEHPPVHKTLRKNRLLLSTLNHLASHLRESHMAWRDNLQRAKPESDPSQIASEALERALQQLKIFLAFLSSPGPNVPPTLDAAMAFLHGRRTLE
jgi:hypothetical protein